MVVPTNNSSDFKTKTKRIVGDGRHIVLNSNSDLLLVVGCGNHLEIVRNDGEIQVVGDGCTVSVLSGNGTIKYIGDGGFLQTGNLDFNRITYEGDGGKIVTADGTTRSYQKNKSRDRNCNSCENMRRNSRKCETFYVQNKTNLTFRVPNHKNVTCVHLHVPIPKIRLSVSKCKYNNS